MKLKLIIILLIFFSPKTAFCQSAFYCFKTLSNIAHHQKDTAALNKSIDSIKKVWIKTGFGPGFNRNIDFGFKHERFDLLFKQIDIVRRNDTVCLVSVMADNDTVHKYVTITDTGKLLFYISQRNSFYGSCKTLNNLVSDIRLNIDYSFYCGDGNYPTEEGIYIDKLVRKKDIGALRLMLNSINCETQAYGVTGIKMLQKKDFKINKSTLHLVTYLQKRKSPVQYCEGCFGGVK